MAGSSMMLPLGRGAPASGMPAGEEGPRVQEWLFQHRPYFHVKTQILYFLKHKCGHVVWSMFWKWGRIFDIGLSQTVRDIWALCARRMRIWIAHSSLGAQRCSSGRAHCLWCLSLELARVLKNLLVSLPLSFSVQVSKPSPPHTHPITPPTTPPMHTCLHAFSQTLLR